MGKRKGKRYKIEERGLITQKAIIMLKRIRRIIAISIVIILVSLVIACFIKKDEIVDFFESKSENQIEVLAQNESQDKVKDVTKTENQNNTKIESEKESNIETQNKIETKNETGTDNKAKQENNAKVVEQKDNKNENQTKTETEKKENTKSQILKDKKYNNMKITDIEIKKDASGYSHLKCVIKNNTGKKYKGEKVYFIFIGKNKVELAKFSYKLKEIKSGKSLKVHLVTSTDITNSKDFYIKKQK